MSDLTRYDVIRDREYLRNVPVVKAKDAEESIRKMSVPIPDDSAELRKAHEHWASPITDVHCDNLTVASSWPRLLRLCCG
jgi:hypothetical protein